MTCQITDKWKHEKDLITPWTYNAFVTGHLLISIS